MKVLFICKAGNSYSKLYDRKRSGLHNSTQYIVKSLVKRGVPAKIVDVVDNNCIDREVTDFRPTVVVIEALWVVPEKFKVLRKHHPHVKWFVHLHSNIPFIAMEGMAMRWIPQYSEDGVGVIANSLQAYHALKVIDRNVIYLPNVYIPRHQSREDIKFKSLQIACFGAVRPLKNHLIQAMAAIEFAREKDKPLHFHINFSRVEQGGEPILKNLRALFDETPNAYLIEHPWIDPKDLHRHLQHMDIGMQVSLSETFNVVTADYISSGVPVVVSKEIDWVSCLSQCDDNDIRDIVHKMHRAYKNQLLIWWNRRLLNAYSDNAQEAWFRFIFSQCE